MENGGNYPGVYVLNALKKHPELICQIDAGTGETETYKSAYDRSVALAKAFLTYGLKPGDVIALSGINHLDLRIVYYAGLAIGCAIAGVDPLLKYNEIKNILGITRPKLSFCQKNMFEDTSLVLEELGLPETKVVVFDGEFDLKAFLRDYGTKNATNEKLVPPEFDSSTTMAWLLSTSGSTGRAKVASFTHATVFKVISIISKRKAEGSKHLLLSPIQWTSAFLYGATAPITGATVLQTSKPATVEHVIDIINEYKPNTTLFVPNFLAQILDHPKKCDFTCFNVIIVGGSKPYRNVFEELKTKVGPKTVTMDCYAQTESMMLLFDNVPNTPIGSCGKLHDGIRDKVKFVDIDTDRVITEPNVTGELLIREPHFSGYYGMPEETKAAFTPDGWFKTGDMFYRDENDFIYFVDRVKMMIKYCGYHVVPIELEELIRTHPGVLDVAVTSIPDEKWGELPTACVIPRPGHQVTAQEIKDLVANNLSDSKQLRGGVVFLDEFPLTGSGKISRTEIKKLVKELPRQ